MKTEKSNSNSQMVYGLKDIYPHGHLTGATVKEAIDHSYSTVQTDIDNGFLILDGPAIKYLIDIEFQLKKLKYHNTYFKNKKNK
jgi:hypothetical protein